MRAIMAVALVPPLLEMLSLTRLERLLSSRSRAPGAPVNDAALAQWVDETMAWLPRPWTRTCLRRAAVLFYLLRRDGRLVDLCIGVRRAERGDVLAHAWLVSGGTPYLEPEKTRAEVAQYNLIAQFPRTQARAEP
ncbi:MAG: hypothetical protein JWM95_3670 [Gemmatimonadetes bacterium]|nr:hypothetical protein [Gemmatimonadota bacterium]